MDVAVSAPIAAASLALFRRLSPGQIDLLFSGTELRFTTLNGALPPAAAEDIRKSTSVLESIYGPLPQLPADATIRLIDVPDEDDLPPRRNRQLWHQCATATLRGEKERPHRIAPAT